MNGGAQPPAGPQPLAGIRVLDLSQVLAGPFCAMLLGELGAEVVKVEPPRGDAAREFGPFVRGTSTYHRLVNRGKLGIVLDLKLGNHRARLQALVERADVLVESFRPGTLARLGLDVDDLRELNPRLVVASISGFGRTGPLAALPAYDLIVQAMSGLMAATGPVGGGPTRVAVSVGDLVPGLYAALGVVTALLARERSGRGAHVDVAMLDSLLSLLESLAMRALHTDDAVEPLGNDHALSAPFGTYRTADGVVAVAVAADPLFVRLAEALDHPEWARDPRFERDELRAANRVALQEELEGVLAGLGSEEAIDRLRGAGIPVAPILSVREALAQPQALAREMVVEEEDGFRTLGRVLGKGGGIPSRRAPALGEHDRLVDDWLAEHPRTGLP